MADLADARAKAEEALANFERFVFIGGPEHPDKPYHDAGVNLATALRALLAAWPEAPPPPSDAVPLPVCIDCSFASGGHVHLNREDGTQAVRAPTAEEWNAAIRQSPPSDAVREAAEAVSQTYYEIAAEAIGEDKVKAEFSSRFEERLAKRRDAARGGE